MPWGNIAIYHRKNKTVEAHEQPTHRNRDCRKTYKKLWKDPPFFMGTSTISTGPCSIAMLVIARPGINGNSFSSHQFPANSVRSRPPSGISQNRLFWGSMPATACLLFLFLLLLFLFFNGFGRLQTCRDREDLVNLCENLRI